MHRIPETIDFFWQLKGYNKKGSENVMAGEIGSLELWINVSKKNQINFAEVWQFWKGILQNQK